MGPQPIVPGERLKGIPSEGWNGFVEMYRRYMQGPGQPNGTGRSSGARRLTALVKNNSGAAIDVQFGIVELDGPVFDTDDRETVIHEGIAFKGIEPDAATSSGSIAIFQGPVGDAQSMDAVIVGPTWVRLELPTWNSTYQTAGPTAGDCTKLTAGTGSIRVHWHAAPADAMADTEVWALVELSSGGASAHRKARVTTTITAATGTEAADWGSGEGKLCDPDSGELADEAIGFDNEWNQSFGVDYQVMVDTSYSPPRVVNGTCAALDAETYWGDEA